MRYALKSGASAEAKRFFLFDTEEHKEALGMELGPWFRRRLEGPNKFEILKTGDSELIKNIAGLYWLEYCIASKKLGSEFLPKAKKAKALFEVLLAQTSEMMVSYLTAICGGELRHMRRKASATGCKKCEPLHQKWNGLPNLGRESGSEAFWKYIAANGDTYGKAFDLLLHGFCDHEWPGGGFGGKRWGYIVYLAMRLHCAWVEGSQAEMMRYLDFIVHAVHNGANCLHDKFVFYHTGPAYYLTSILTAKFYGHECCWAKIRQHVPKTYALVELPKQAMKKMKMKSPLTDKMVEYEEPETCSHKLKRDTESIGKEEQLFCEFFREATTCAICGTKEKEGSCPLECGSCGHVELGIVHEHSCPGCGRTKTGAAINDKKCPLACDKCWALYQTDPAFNNPYYSYRGCQCVYCHKCSKLRRFVSWPVVGIGESIAAHTCQKCFMSICPTDAPCPCQGVVVKTGTEFNQVISASVSTVVESLKEDPAIEVTIDGFQKAVDDFLKGVTGVTSVKTGWAKPKPYPIYYKDYINKYPIPKKEKSG